MTVYVARSSPPRQPAPSSPRRAPRSLRPHAGTGHMPGWRRRTPARPATSSARSPSATRAGSPASATARRSTAGGTGARTGARPPSPSNNASRPGPTCASTPTAYPTGYANLGNGQPATLFSSYDQQTVDTHFALDAAERLRHRRPAALQPDRRRGPDPRRDDRQGAHRREAYGRKFYIMYDVTGWTNMQSEIKPTGRTRCRRTPPPRVRAPERQAGRRHLGLRLQRHQPPLGAAACLDVVNWFKAQGCYVIGGVPTYWRTGVATRAPAISTSTTPST